MYDLYMIALCKEQTEILAIISWKSFLIAVVTF